MNLCIRVGAVLLTMTCALQSRADETQVRLRDGPAAATVRASCSICHSLDYIQMNAPFLNRAAWEAEVRKMIKIMGAPIPEQDVAQIVDYLTMNYGVP